MLIDTALKNYDMKRMRGWRCLSTQYYPRYLMDVQAMASVDKTLYEGLSRLSILTATYVCLQMSVGGQIQQQNTICSFLSPLQHEFTVLKTL